MQGLLYLVCLIPPTQHFLILNFKKGKIQTNVTDNGFKYEHQVGLKEKETLLPDKILYHIKTLFSPTALQTTN